MSMCRFEIMVCLLSNNLKQLFVVPASPNSTRVSTDPSSFGGILRSAMNSLLMCDGGVSSDRSVGA